MLPEDLRKIMQLRYIENKVKNVFPDKYRKCCINDDLIRSATRIVRFFKRTRFNSCYNKQESQTEPGFHYTHKDDARAGILFFRFYNDGIENVISLCEEFDSSVLSPSDYERYIKQKELIDTESISGMKYVQDMEFETAIIKDNIDLMKFENYMFYVIKNIDLTSIELSFDNSSFDIEYKMNEIVQCDDIGLDISLINITNEDKTKIIRYLRILRFIDNYDKIIDYINSTIEKEWIISNITVSRELIDKINSIYSDKLYKIVNDIIKVNIKSEFMCCGCYNNFDKYNIIKEEDDMIYCFDCYNKLFNNDEREGWFSNWW